MALSCDDGTDYDWRDVIHPEHGLQTSFAESIRSFQRERPGSSRRFRSPVCHRQSQSARRQIDVGAMGGQGALNDDWWQAANASGLMPIESHGWDHNHPPCRRWCSASSAAAIFSRLIPSPKCDMHVRAAANFIESRARAGDLRCLPPIYPWTPGVGVHALSLHAHRRRAARHHRRVPAARATPSRATAIAGICRDLFQARLEQPRQPQMLALLDGACRLTTGQRSSAQKGRASSPRQCGAACLLH